MQAPRPEGGSHPGGSTVDEARLKIRLANAEELERLREIEAAALRREEAAAGLDVDRRVVMRLHLDER
jgi:predicted DNA-binding protein (UPF0251 family)